LDVVVKGGMALELRTARARSTRDIALRAMGQVERFEVTLRDVAVQDVADCLTFSLRSCDLSC